MRRIKVYAVLISAINFFFFSCASHTSSYTNNSDIPSRFLNPYEIYAKEQYIAAVGVGDTLQMARSAALAALAQQIEVSVKSSQQIEEFFLMSTAGFREDSVLFGNSNVHSMGKFVGLQYAESFHHKDKNIYTIAYINRLSAANIYRGRIDDATKTIHSLLEASVLKEGLEKIAILLRAIALSVKNDAMFSQLDVISPTISRLVRSNKRYTTPLLKNQLKGIASRIVFAVPITVNLLYDAKFSLNTQEIENQIKASITQMLTSLQLRISENENEVGHALETEINISQKTEKYPTLLWQLTINIKDEFNTIVLSKTQRGNAQGLDIAAAKRLAISDMEKIITTLFSDYIRNAFFAE